MLPISTDNAQSPARMTRVDVSLNSGAPFDSFRQFLPVRGYVVYVLQTAFGDTLYVGQTRTPRLRMRRHWRTQPWFPLVSTITLHGVGDELSARALEKQLTGETAPEHSVISASDERRLQNLLAASS